MKKVGIATLISLVVAIVGVIAPILWDYYKTRTALELQVTSRTTIIDSKQGIEKLSVFYDRKKIPSITKYTFTIINTGRSPILKKDIIDNIKIKFRTENEILEGRLSNYVPANLEVDSVIDPKNNLISISFPLLNPSDSMVIDVFVSGTDPKFTASARISGIANLQVVDKTTVNKSKFKNLDWYLLIIVAILLFCYVLSVMFLIYYGQRSEIKRLWVSGSITIPEDLSKSQFIEFIKKTFSVVSAESALTSALNTLNLLTSDTVDNEQRKVVINEINKAITNNRDPLYASISFGTVSVAGTIFILYNII